VPFDEESPHFKEYVDTITNRVKNNAAQFVGQLNTNQLLPRATHNEHTQHGTTFTTEPPDVVDGVWKLYDDEDVPNVDPRPIDLLLQQHDLVVRCKLIEGGCQHRQLERAALQNCTVVHPSIAYKIINDDMMNAILPISAPVIKVRRKENGLPWDDEYYCPLLMSNVPPCDSSVAQDAIKQRVGLVLNELRQAAMLRVVEDDDAFVLMCEHGELATVCDTAILLSTLHWFGFVVDFNANSAGRPTHLFQLNDELISTTHMTRYADPTAPTHDEHAEIMALSLVYTEWKIYKPVDIQVLRKAIIQQRSHIRTDWKSRILICQLEDELRDAERRIIRVPTVSPQAKPYPSWEIRPSTDEVVDDLRALLAPKVRGEAVGEPDECLGTLKVGTSTLGVGFNFTRTDATTNTTTDITVPMLYTTEKEQRAQPACVGVSIAIQSIIYNQSLSSNPNTYSTLRVCCTSEATVAIINKGHHRNTSSTPLREALLLARKRQILLRASLILPGEIPPAYRGRTRSLDEEWGLHKEQAKAILVHIQIDPDNPHLVDCMAGRTTKICERYISRFIDDAAMYQDIMAYTLPRGMLYCYPPRSMLNCIITKIIAERRTTILVAPLVPFVPLKWSTLVPYVKRAFAIPYHKRLHYAPEGDCKQFEEGDGARTNGPRYPLLVMIVTGKDWNVDHYPSQIQQLARANASAPELTVDVLDVVMPPVQIPEPTALEKKYGVCLGPSQDELDMMSTEKSLALARKLLSPQ
jgi:hypothetical protein